MTKVWHCATLCAPDSSTVPHHRLEMLQRSSKRACVSLPQSVFEALVELADEQGRSTSNLIAYIVEAKLQELKSRTG